MHRCRDCKASLKAHSQLHKREARITHAHLQLSKWAVNRARDIIRRFSSESRLWLPPQVLEDPVSRTFAGVKRRWFSRTHCWKLANGVPSRSVRLWNNARFSRLARDQLRRVRLRSFFPTFFGLHKDFQVFSTSIRVDLGVNLFCFFKREREAGVIVRINWELVCPGKYLVGFVWQECARVARVKLRMCSVDLLF